MGDICMCCTSQNTTMIPMKNCKHTKFLKTYIKFKFDDRNVFVCVICHNMLKKIDTFKQQIEESIALLTDQTHIFNLTKLHNLTSSLPQITDSTRLSNLLDFVFKVEVDDTQKEEPTDIQEVDCMGTDHDYSIQNYDDIVTTTTVTKLEYDSEETVSDIEFAGTKDKNQDLVDKTDKQIVVIDTEAKKPAKQDEQTDQYVNYYEGRIKIINLSMKQMNEERMANANDPKYLNLPFKCEFCIIGFDHEHNLQKHNENRHKKRLIDKRLKCNICTSVLKTKASYYEHMKRHLLRYECVDCKKRYTNIYKSIEHYNEKHLPPGVALDYGYTCRLCGYHTNLNRKYRYHMDKHKARLECKICYKFFVNASSLKTHLFTIHSQSSRVYSCTKCNKQYRNRSGLSYHRCPKASQEDPPAYCTVCNTHYVTVKSLNAHLASHSNHIKDKDKRFICDDCGAKFVRKIGLEDHITWEHLKIVRHRCTKCDKEFRSKKGLYSHVAYVHNKVRPVKDKICHMCGIAFSTKAILQSHIRTHTGERPLSCRHCNATFGHSGALYTHIKLKHKKVK